MTSKEQCEKLMEVLLPFAENQLKRYREFYPVAAVMMADGSIDLTDCYDGNEYPDTQAILEALKQIHRKLAQEEKILASGIVWNASLGSADGKPTDAIVISLEHKEGYSAVVGEPYKIGFLKKVTLGNLIAMEGKHEIF